MSVVQSLIHHLLDPLLIGMALVAGLLPLQFKMRLVVAFTIGLIIELLFVSKHDTQVFTVFTFLTGTLAAFCWMTVSKKLREWWEKRRS